MSMENKIAENERLIQDIEISPKTWLKVGAGLKTNWGRMGLRFGRNGPKNLILTLI